MEKNIINKVEKHFSSILKNEDKILAATLKIWKEKKVDLTNLDNVKKRLNKVEEEEKKWLENDDKKTLEDDKIDSKFFFLIKNVGLKLMEREKELLIQIIDCFDDLTPILEKIQLKINNSN